MEVKTVCPLGCECERVVDSHVERCAWYVKLSGSNPQSGKPLEESRCAMSWQPILMIEGNGVAHSLVSSVQSMRNETVKRQDVALKVLNGKAITGN